MEGNHSPNCKLNARIGSTERYEKRFKGAFIHLEFLKERDRDWKILEQQ